MDETLAWRALHAFFGYCGASQQYKLFLDTFRVGRPGLTLLRAMTLIAAAAETRVLVLVIDDVQVLTCDRWPRGAKDCAVALRKLQYEARQLPVSLLVCCAVAGTRDPGDVEVAARDGSDTLEVCILNGVVLRLSCCGRVWNGMMDRGCH